MEYKLGTYKFVKHPNKFLYRVKVFLKSVFVLHAKMLAIALILAGTFTAGQYSNPKTVFADRFVEVNTLDEKIDKMKNQVIEQIAKLETHNAKTEDGLIVFDDNSRGTLSRKDKVSIGCMQFKVGTVQHYTKILDKKDISNYEATLIALDCEKAKALAKRVIFEVQGGLWNWSVATEEMGNMVTIIKELSK